MNDTLKLTQVYVDEARHGTTAEVRHLLAGHPTTHEASRLDEIAERGIEEPHYYDGEAACWLRDYTLHEVPVIVAPPIAALPGSGRHELDLKAAQDLKGLYDIAGLYEGRLVTGHIRVTYDSAADYLDRIELTESGSEEGKARGAARNNSRINSERNACGDADAHEA
ncbi:MAG: hypothetical protein M3P51_00805 [Chloroflexota bacterium]|nr:hypothetical protein [Chloroflexota bacterium]